jgi:hypothetical protein
VPVRPDEELGAAHMRVLINTKPRLYRESLALTLRRYRPDFEVRVAAPEGVEEEIRSFAPQLLVRNDTDGLDEGVSQRVPFRVEVRYSDSMSARIDSNYEVSDISTEGLLRVADEAAAWLGGA